MCVCRADPIHRGPCILDALRVRWRARQRARDHITRGSCQRYVHKADGSLVCAETCQYLAFEASEASPSVAVRDLQTDGVIHRWPMPSICRLSPRVFPGQASWDGRTLALEISSRSSINAGLFDNGVLLLHSETGACTPVVLHTGASQQLCMSSFFSAGHLLVQHRAVEGGHRHHGLSIISATGDIITSHSAPAGWFRHSSCWAPNGRTALLYSGSSFWLWDAQVNSEPAHHQLAKGFNTINSCWSMDSSRLLLQGAERVIVWAPQYSQQVQHLPQQFRIAWGCCDTVAFVRCVRSLGFGEEETYTRATHMLTLSQVSSDGSLQPISMDGEMHDSCSHSLSLDGTLLCLSTDFRQEGAGIDVIDLKERKLLGHFETSFMPCWIACSADATRLIVQGPSGLDIVLLKFA